MRLTWATDIHLDFVPDDEHGDLYARLLAEDPSAILLSGDIANGRKVCAVLADLARFVARPVYFVLGNHDYYGRSVREFRATMTEFAAATPHLHYLTAGGIVELSAETALIGHDGWADARFGRYERSTVFLVTSNLVCNRRVRGGGPQATFLASRNSRQTLAAYF